MPFLWLSVPARADRGSVERNSIALTSCLANGQDPPSSGWLGGCAARPEISQSGLWNVDHVRHHCEPGFLDLLERLLLQQGRMVLAVILTAAEQGVLGLTSAHKHAARSSTPFAAVRCSPGNGAQIAALPCIPRLARAEQSALEYEHWSLRRGHLLLRNLLPRQSF